MSNQKKWFFLKNNEVSGPYLASEIDPLSAVHPEGLIWGQGFNEWVVHSEWKKTLLHLDEVMKGLQDDMKPTWMVKYDNQAGGPYTYDQMVQLLKAHPKPSETLIKQISDYDWKGIYDFAPLVEEVGITRRQHNRVPISGLLKYHKDGHHFEALLSSISQGGIGILEAQGIGIGDNIKGEIQSPQLPAVISCHCDVLYQQADGNWGLKFINLPMESLTIIVEYTRKFQSASND